MSAELHLLVQVGGVIYIFSITEFLISKAYFNGEKKM